jgi:hypothetical protein
LHKTIKFIEGRNIIMDVLKVHYYGRKLIAVSGSGFMSRDIPLLIIFRCDEPRNKYESWGEGYISTMGVFIIKCRCHQHILTYRY